MGLITDLTFLLLAILSAFILYPIWIDFVYKFQMGEDVRPDGPQSHQVKKGTPTMGGLVFVLVVALITFLFNSSRTQTLFPVFVAALAGLFGLIEDFTKVYKKSGLPGFFEYHFNFLIRFINKVTGRDKKINILTKLKDKTWGVFVEFWRVVGSSGGSGMQTYQKFLIQALIAGFVSYWTFIKLGWDTIWFPLVGEVHFGFLYPITIFITFIIVLNFVAFVDGLDGLAGGLGLIALIAFWALARYLEYYSLAAFCATFVGALIPFLYFNIYPARIFMGNVGSHVLGAVLTVLAIVLRREFALIIICFVFLADGVTSPLQSLSVKLTRKRLFRMAPIHHHFEMLGWPETKVTLRFWIFGAIFGLIGLLVALL